MTNIFFVLINSLFVLTATYSQSVGFDYCSDNIHKDTLIGKKVKIYSSPCESVNIDFSLYGINDSTLIKKINNEYKYLDNRPFNEGAIGEIVYVSDKAIRIYSDGSGSIQPKFYIVKIGEDYYSFKCRCLIEPSELDFRELVNKWDELYKEYDKECGFNYESADWIDKYSSNFACKLYEQKVDTILYAKKISTGFARKNHVSIVLWYNDGYGYVKLFYNKGCNKPVIESEIYHFNWSVLLKSYTDNKPKFKNYVSNSKFSHYMYYEVTLMISGDDLYNGFEWSNDDNVPNYNSFVKGNSSVTDFYFYLENIFKIIN